MKTKFDKDIEKLNSKSQRFSSTNHNFEMLKIDYWSKLLKEQFENAPESNFHLMDSEHNLDLTKLNYHANECLKEHIKYFEEYIK